MTRQLPTTIPQTSHQLRAMGLSRRRITKDFIPSDHGVYVPRDVLDNNHPLYGLDPVIRARSYHLFNPNCIFTGLTALAFTGLRYFVHNQPTTMLLPHYTRNPFSTVKRSSPQFEVAEGNKPLIIRRRWHYGKQHKPQLNKIEKIFPDPELPDLAVCRPMLALGQALTSIMNQDSHINQEEWFLPTPTQSAPGLPAATTVHAIQLADAVFALLDMKLAPNKIIDKMKTHYPRLINIRKCQKAIEMSDSGCQSPPETLMRLIIQPNLKNTGFRYVTQVEITHTGLRVTTLDALLVHPEHPLFKKISQHRHLELRELPHLAGDRKNPREHLLGLQYDGVHHLDRVQRDNDARIDSDLWDYRLLVKRVTASELRDPVRLIKMVDDKIIEQR